MKPASWRCVPGLRAFALSRPLQQVHGRTSVPIVADVTAGRTPRHICPDIDDGVKVNVRPFQETSLFSVKQVIKKW